MQPITEEVNSKKNKILLIIYDFVRMRYLNNKTINVHLPNLCVAHQVGTDCIGDDDVSLWCNTCGVRDYVFHEAPVVNLIKLCICDNTDFCKIICIVHNARAFDAIYIKRSG